MNGIILYGSRYGAARQYAQALEERTGLPAVSYAEARDFGPFDTIVYVGGLYVGKTTGLAKTARRLPTDHPFRLLVATVGLADPANEDNLLSIRESLAKELSPGIFVRTAHVPLRGAIDYQALSTKHRAVLFPPMGLPLLVGRPFPQRVSLPLRLQQVKQKFPHLKGVTLGRLPGQPKRRGAHILNHRIEPFAYPEHRPAALFSNLEQHWPPHWHTLGIEVGGIQQVLVPHIVSGNLPLLQAFFYALFHVSTPTFRLLI